MKKYLLLISTFLLFTSFESRAASAPAEDPAPAEGAAARRAGAAISAVEESFLDGYMRYTSLTKEEFTPSIFWQILEPFFKNFLGSEIRDSNGKLKPGVVISIGAAAHEMEVHPEHFDRWKAALDKRITHLREGIVTHPRDNPREIPYPTHTVTDVDIQVAKALYEVMIARNPDGRKKYNTFYEVRKVVREMLNPILAFAITSEEESLKFIIKVWAYLTSLKQDAWPAPLEYFVEDFLDRANPVDEGTLPGLLAGGIRVALYRLRPH